MRRTDDVDQATRATPLRSIVKRFWRRYRSAHRRTPRTWWPPKQLRGLAVRAATERTFGEYGAGVA
eukprot:8556888-Alexandrium_andersonii.AAC.1